MRTSQTFSISFIIRKEKKQPEVALQLFDVQRPKQFMERPAAYTGA